MAFEGTLKLRTVSVDRSALNKTNGGKALDLDQTLALTPDKLLASKDLDAQDRESMVYVSGTKVRMDTPMERSKDSFAIIDTEKSLTWFVVPSEQRAQVAAMLKNMKGGADGEAPPKVELKPFGKPQTINGMPSTGYQVKTGDETMVGWVTQEQPDLSKLLRTVQERMEKMTPPSMRGRQSARTALGEKGFPVMMQTVDPDHYRVEEVTAVEKKAVPADMFVIPKDFTKTTGREAMNKIPDKLPE